MPELSPRPAIAAEPISVVLPVRDAATSVRKSLNEWAKVLKKRKKAYEMIVVDDGSTDETPQILDELAPTLEHLKVVHKETPQGFGAALREGIALAQYPLLCYCPADGRYEPGDLTKMLDAVDSVDVVAGYRVWQKPPQGLRVAGFLYRLAVRVLFGIPLEPWPNWLGWSGLGRRWLVRWVFGVFVHDAECAFRLCRRELLSRIPIQSHGSFAHSEILAKANFLNAYIGQVPVTYHPPQGEAIGAEKFSWCEFRAVFSHPKFNPTLTVKTESEPTAPTSPVAE